MLKMTFCPNYMVTGQVFNNIDIYQQDGFVLFDGQPGISKSMAILLYSKLTN